MSDHTRAIADQARTIRIPVHMIETINKLVRTQRQLVQELGREPTSEGKIGKAAWIFRSQKVRQDFKDCAGTGFSLETPIGEKRKIRILEISSRTRLFVSPSGCGHQSELEGTDLLRAQNPHSARRESDQDALWT